MGRQGLVLMIVATLGCGPVQPAAVAPAARGGRFVTVAMQDGKAWLLRPDGERMLSLGVNAIGDASYNAPNDRYYDPVRKQYGGDKERWARTVLERLVAWSFNTVGSWSDEILYGRSFYYTAMLYSTGFAQKPLEHAWDGVLDKLVRDNANRVDKYKDDPYLVGYFLENELPWWGEFGWQTGGKSLLDRYLAKPKGDANKPALVAFFRDRYRSDIGAFNRTWGLALARFEDLDAPLELAAPTRRQNEDAMAFAGKVADRYLDVVTRAVRARDPNHLVLCVRFAGETPWPVVEAAGRYCDIVSVNHYAKSGNIDRTFFDNVYATSKRPVLISEYSFSAMENQSGDPNTRGADVTVKTQADRAEHFTRYARQALSLPYVVGLHWFEWADESPQGRFDGEDQNYGLVDIGDVPYAIVTQAHTRLNREASTLHAATREPLPAKFAALKEPTLRAAKAGTALAPTREVLRGGDPKQNGGGYGDEAKGGKSTLDKGGAELVISYQTGTGWGTGVWLTPNVGPFVGGSAVDVSGYASVELDLEAPAKVKLQLLLTEAGAGPPDKGTYEGTSGSDGESYDVPAVVGTGKRTKYRIDLTEIRRRTSWGNQHGNLVLDLQALSGLDLSLPGGQGDGKLRVWSIAFVQ
jgi:hypothetical protein